MTYGNFGGKETRVRKLPRSQKRDPVFVPQFSGQERETERRRQCVPLFIWNSGGRLHIPTWAATVAQKQWLSETLQKERLSQCFLSALASIWLQETHKFPCALLGHGELLRRLVSGRILVTVQGSPKVWGTQHGAMVMPMLNGKCQHEANGSTPYTSVNTRVARHVIGGMTG